MALVWDDMAIASVGMSCQAAHQILHHRPLLEALVGAPAEVAGTPFDWLIAPPAGAAEMLRAGRYVPDRLAVAHEVPAWDELGVLYWHDRARDLPTLAEKFAHTGATLDRLLAGRPLLVFTNLQRNLDTVAGLFPRADPVVRRADLLPLEDAVRARGRGEVYYVLSEERTPDPDAWPAERTAFAPLTDSEWKGDKPTWAAALARFVAHFRP